MVRAFLLVSVLLVGPVAATPEEAFWQWFGEHEQALFELDPYDIQESERLFDDVATQLVRVDSGLTFEMGFISDTVREFIVSADGVKAVFPVVERLVQAAPMFEKWKIIAFRPRRPPEGPLRLGDLEVNPINEYVKLYPGDSAIGLVVYLKGYVESRKYDFWQAGFLLLDQILGEYDVEMKVGFIDFEPLRGKLPDGAVRMDSLAVAFDSVWGGR